VISGGIAGDAGGAPAIGGLASADLVLVRSRWEQQSTGEPRFQLISYTFSMYRAADPNAAASGAK
jgi:hypothetical protein